MSNKFNHKRIDRRANVFLDKQDVDDLIALIEHSNRIHPMDQNTWNRFIAIEQKLIKPFNSGKADGKIAPTTESTTST